MKIQGEQVAYTELERAIKDFEKEYTIDSIVPVGEEVGLGFKLKKNDTKEVYKRYSKLIRKSLCRDEGEFNKLIKTGIATMVGSILTSIVTALGLPAIALPVMIAVLIFHTAWIVFAAFRKWTTNSIRWYLRNSLKNSMRLDSFLGHFK